MKSQFPILLSSVLLWSGCTKIEDAPVGLDDSTNHLFHAMYGSDLEVGTGLTGLLEWFDTEGMELMELQPTLDNIDTFSVAPLTESDVDLLELDDADRDFESLEGIVAIGTTPCTPFEADALLMRGDQQIVFEDTFVNYERSFVSSLLPYQAASVDESVPAVNESIDRGEADRWEANLLQSTNTATTSQGGVQVDYDLVHTLRHGTFRTTDKPVNAMIALSWIPTPSDPDKSVQLIQQYALEVVVQRQDEQALRLLSIWSQGKFSLGTSDSPFWTTGLAVQAQNTGERMNQICSGDIELPPEE